MHLSVTPTTSRSFRSKLILSAMEAGYSVGTRTIVDVLDATTTLFNASEKLANARYNYLINELNIKSALGTLNSRMPGTEQCAEQTGFH